MLMPARLSKSFFPGSRFKILDFSCLHLINKVFVDAANYQKIAIEVLSSLVQITHPFQVILPFHHSCAHSFQANKNSFIAIQFNRVFTVYLQLLLLTASLKIKKQFACIFALCHRIVYQKIHEQQQKYAIFSSPHNPGLIPM